MGYRYVDLGEYDAGNNSCRSQAGVQTSCNIASIPLSTELSAHEVMLNLKYRF
jgi:opacity protein-like surface antigen